MSWLALQLAVALLAAGAALLLRLLGAGAVPLHRALLLALPLLAFAPSWGPEQRPFSAPVMVWAPAGATPTVRVAPTAPALPLPDLRGAALLLPAGAVLRLVLTLRGSRRLRRIRGVEIRVAPHARLPFAAWWGRPLVVLDPDTAFDPALAELAIRHELQHHRAGDPRWAWLLVALSAAFPAALLLRAPLAAAEELACDAALARRVDVRAYAAALLRLAGVAPGPLAAAFGGLSLRWRLSMLLRPPEPGPARRLAAALLLPLGFLLAAPIAWAGGGLVADFDPTSIALAGADHPRVRAAFERLGSTPEGRAWMAGSVERARPLLPWVEARLAEAGLPRALAAVPLVESGYRNLRSEDLSPKVPPWQRGAGHWMFIASTARRYGLRVDEEVDERLDLAKETAAAIALLRDDHARYGDWALALAAYNQGERAVDAAIAQGGVRDAFALEEAGLLNSYAAEVYAAAIWMGL